MLYKCGLLWPWNTAIVYSQPDSPKLIYVADVLLHQHTTTKFPVYPERTFLFIEHLAQVEHKMLWKYLSFFLYWSKRLTATRGKKGKAIKRVMYHPTNFKTISVVIVCDHRQLFTWWWKHVTISSNKSLYLTHFHTSPCDQVCSFVDQICDDKPLLIFTAAVGDESIIKNIIKTPAEGDACACLSCYPHTPKMQISFR